MMTKIMVCIAQNVGIREQLHKSGLQMSTVGTKS